MGDIFRGRRPRKISSTEGVINLVFHTLKGAIIILVNQPRFSSATPASNSLRDLMAITYNNSELLERGFSHQRFALLNNIRAHMHVY